MFVIVSLFLSAYYARCVTIIDEKRSQMLDSRVIVSAKCIFGHAIFLRSCYNFEILLMKNIVVLILESIFVAYRISY